jgi:FKBP-type peptidyl-prolyl cis-trans isomerase
MYLIRFLLFILSTNYAEGTEEPLTQQKIKRYSEYVGYTMGKDFQVFGIPFDAEAVVEGLRKFSAGYDPKDLLEGQNEFDYIIQIQSELFDKKARENAVKAQIFFTELEKKASVVKLQDKKLYYELIKEGTGVEAITETSKPWLSYSAYTFEGEKIADIFQENYAIQVSVQETVPGFVQGVIGMKKDERRKLYVHPDLAYKRSGPLPPNSVLIFDVEVFDFEEEDTKEHNINRAEDE